MAHRKTLEEVQSSCSSITYSRKMELKWQITVSVLLVRGQISCASDIPDRFLFENTHYGEPMLRQLQFYRLYYQKDFPQESTYSSRAHLLHPQCNDTHRKVCSSLYSSYCWSVWQPFPCISSSSYWSKTYSDCCAVMGKKKSFLSPLSLQHINYKLVLSLSQYMQLIYSLLFVHFFPHSPELCAH